MGDFKEPTALLKKSRGISPVLAACPISDALITRIPADEEPLCGNAAVYQYAIIIIIIIIIIIVVVVVGWRDMAVKGLVTLIFCTLKTVLFQLPFPLQMF